MIDKRVQPKRILVVEDEKDFAVLISSLLTQAGHEVTVAYSCEEGLETARQIKPHLITLDLQMPPDKKRSGLHFYRQLRSWAGFKDVPVVVVTGVMRDNRDMESLARAFLEPDHVPPPNAYVDKPFDNQAFLGMVRNLLADEESVVAR